jgi:hypothetical protein
MEHGREREAFIICIGDRDDEAPRRKPGRR